MLTFAEQRSIPVVNGHPDLTDVILKVDKSSRDYSIQLYPTEARAFTQASEAGGQNVDAAVFTLITLIDETMPPGDRGPGHPDTGRPFHTYHIGRRRGHRELTLELLRIKTPESFEPMSLVQTLQAYANSVGAIAEFDEDPYRWTGAFIWVKS